MPSATGDSGEFRSLLPGDKAPDFKSKAVFDGKITDCFLKQYKGKYLVLFFYPLDFTFVCPTEIIAFSERIEEFKQRNCEILACSTDSEYSHLAWTKLSKQNGGLGNIGYPLMVDKNMKISKSYGVLQSDDGVAFRGLFIIDKTMHIRQITINDMPIGRSVDETLRLVDAIQFYEENGEVCPANWRKGDKTIKPNPEDSKAYFKAIN